MGVIQGIIQVVLGIIQGDWDGVMSGLKQIASSIWNGIKGVISGQTAVVLTLRLNRMMPPLDQTS